MQAIRNLREVGSALCGDIPPEHYSVLTCRIQDSLHVQVPLLLLLALILLGAVEATGPERLCQRQGLLGRGRGDEPHGRGHR